MSANARILIATDAVADAELLSRRLREEFDDVTVSTDMDEAVADFERRKPEVLMLAFDTLEKSDRYYLMLYRLCPAAHATPHRTIVLCTKDNVQLGYGLCKNEVYDDYVLFWPIGYDSPRLLMSVHHALRDLRTAQAAPALGEFGAEARRVAQLAPLVGRGLAEADDHAIAASHSVDRAEAEVNAAIDRFSSRLIAGEMTGAADIKKVEALRREIGKLKAEGVDAQFGSIRDSVGPMRQWAGSLKQELAPHLESARALGVLACRIRPLILVVDDETLMCKLFSQFLGRANMDMVFATSGAKALAALRKRLPDLILMDIEMPEMSGVEVTQRLKSMKQFASIPVIMMTGHSEKSVVIESLQAGAVDFIVKPIDWEKLLEKLHRFIGPIDTRGMA